MGYEQWCYNPKIPIIFTKECNIVLRKAKSAVKSILRSVVVMRRERRRLRAELQKSRKLVKSHPEWVALTAQEKAGLRDKDFWQQTAFKNVYGCFAEGFVSDYLYHDILQVLNSINYTGTAFRKSVVNHNLFNNKNYYSLLLKYLPLPKTVIMYINCELLDSDFQLITREAALEKMQAYPHLVFKPASGTGHGKNVSLVDRKDYSETINQYEKYLAGGGATLFRKF